MNWKPFSLHFKQSYNGGYRYLDQCGWFMVMAEDKLGMMPEDAKPDGCKMTLPESGISLMLDTTCLAVAQEVPLDNGNDFIELCKEAADLAQEALKPRGIESNGFASKTYWAMESIQKSQETSLRLGNGFSVDLAKCVDMPARQQIIDCQFRAGSKNLRLNIHPVTFNSLTVRRFNASPLATNAQKQRYERLNKKADRVDTSLNQAIMMELDLVEFDPPENSLTKHFELLLSKQQRLHERYGSI